jgi:hypothetical protein
MNKYIIAFILIIVNDAALFVKFNGEDNDSCGSEEHPCKTISQAFKNCITSGQLTEVHILDYTEMDILNYTKNDSTSFEVGSKDNNSAYLNVSKTNSYLQCNSSDFKFYRINFFLPETISFFLDLIF